jgi:hypothetical protein
LNRRIGGLGGLAFIVLTVGTLFLAPAPPEPSATPAEVAAYFRDNASGIELQAVVFGVAAVALVAFAIGLQERVVPGRRFDGLTGAAWSGVTLLGGGWVLSFALGAGVALYSGRLSDDSIFLGMVAYGSAASVGAIGTVLLLASFALLGHREGALPSWTGAIAAIGVALNLGSLATYTTDSSAVFAVLYAGFGVLAIWIVVVSAILLRSEATDAAITTASPAAA